MIDFECPKHSNAQSAINDVYRIMIEIIESYLEKLQKNELDNALIAELAQKQLQVESILKYDMLLIPQSLYSSLYYYSDKNIKPMLSANWKEKLKEDYASYLKSHFLKEPEGEEWSHLNAYCDYISDDFYVTMSSLCRKAFSTELPVESIWTKIVEFFSGKAKKE